MEAAHLPWRPLGELFVGRGLISEAELETALAEQAATNKRLGEILVDRGLVSGPDLTSVLMEQLGIEISKEEGYGSGLWAEIKRRHPRGRGPDDDRGQVELDPTSESENPFVLVPGGARDEPDHAADLGELEGELEELASDYTPPPPIEAFTEPPPDPDGEGEPEAELELTSQPGAEPVAEAETTEHDPEQASVAAEPEPVEPGFVALEPEPVAVEQAPEPSGSDEVAELRAQLEAAQTEISHLHDMLADSMTALTALHAEATAAVRPTPGDYESL